MHFLENDNKRADFPKISENFRKIREEALAREREDIRKNFFLVSDSSDHWFALNSEAGQKVHLQVYCLTKICIRAKRLISRVLSLFIVPSLLFCTLPVQRPY